MSLGCVSSDKNRPARTEQVTLAHGDVKPGNFAFVDGEVSAIFDWELAEVGDPLADLGYLELLWQMPVGLPTEPGAFTNDELVAHYEKVSGITVHDRDWYVFGMT
jgi:aminoglycoside phosphotransferase (APT) family kinase protein